MKRWILFILALLAVFCILIHSVHGFGIATPYFPNDTITLEPGQVFEYIIRVQNNEDASFNIDLEYESDDDVAYLSTTDFFIPGKSYDNTFTFIIKIPDISTIGKIYTLSYSAKPLINNSGQVPMGVEIKRSAYFMVVESGGQGYFAVTPSYKDRLISNVLTIINESYIYIIGILVLLAALFVGFKLWRIAKKITDKTKTVAPYTISEAKSTDELRTLISMMSDAQFNNEFIRKEYSNRLKELSEEFLSKRVLTEKRKEILRILK